MVKGQKSTVSDLVTRDYTINLHKRLHGASKRRLTLYVLRGCVCVLKREIEWKRWCLAVGRGSRSRAS